LRIAIPGKLTSAFLALQLYLRQSRIHVTGSAFGVVPFDRILEAVAEGAADAGLVIHEGQLTFGEAGLERVVDLGRWWREQTGLPLPLGGNAIRRDLGVERMGEIGRLLKESIAYGLGHREEALDHAQSYGRGLAREKVDRFVGMYVNQRTLDCGADGREAVRLLLERGHGAGVIGDKVVPEWVAC
jgi:1,4-dihydroxy-6-naphthoate synthase